MVIVAHHATVREALQKHGRSLLNRPEDAVLELTQNDLGQSKSCEIDKRSSLHRMQWSYKINMLRHILPVDFLMLDFNQISTLVDMRLTS